MKKRKSTECIPTDRKVENSSGMVTNARPNNHMGVEMPLRRADIGGSGYGFLVHSRTNGKKKED